MTHCPFGDVKLPDAKGNHPKIILFQVGEFALILEKMQKTVGFMVTLGCFVLSSAFDFPPFLAHHQNKSDHLWYSYRGC